MTNEQRERITTMRQGGIGYIKIAQELGLSENTVKSYCRRQKSVVTKEKPLGVRSAENLRKHIKSTNQRIVKSSLCFGTNFPQIRFNF